MFRPLGLLALLGFACVSAVAQSPADIAVSADARSVQPGELVVLTVHTPVPSSRVEVRGFNQRWPAFTVNAETWEALVGIDLDVKPGEHPLSIHAENTDGSEEATYPLSVESKSFRTRTLQVDPAFVTPPPATLARIAREAAELTRIWRSSSPMPLWTGPFIRPVPQPSNSAFGTRSIFNGQPRSPHSGADFLSPAGTPVKAPNAGIVVLADDLYYTGGTVAIDHGAGLVSLFAHLSATNVAKGDHVSTGDIVGKVGSTGRVTGAHLHWTLRVSGARVDPLSLLAVLGD